MQIIIQERVKIVFTSAGSPSKWTGSLQAHGIKVAHVIANSKLAKKCDDAGVDAIVAEGFEAGGHNGREETTSLSLVPAVRLATESPVIAAGGIMTGSQILAALALGAEGVQMGSRFVASHEASGHEAFKNAIVQATEGSTALALKRLVPVRLLKNKFWAEIDEMEQNSASLDDLKTKLGRGRAKKGMFEGDLDAGELEIGQGAALIREIMPVQAIFDELIADFRRAKANLDADVFL